MSVHRIAVACAVVLGASFAACAVDPEPTPPVAATQQAQSAAPEHAALLSPALFDLTLRWRADAAAHPLAAPDLLSYARANAPALVDETIRAFGVPVPVPPGARTSSGECSCRVTSTFTVESNRSTGPTWQSTNSGPAHSASIYQQISGGLGEDIASLAPFRTQFRTSLLCTNSQGLPCAGTCTARLYADVAYSSTVVAAAHAWNIFSRSGTTQVSDGVTLDLRPPFSGAGRRLFEKEASVLRYAHSLAYDADEMANAVKAGLGITVAIVNNQTSLLADLASTLIKALAGIIQREGSDGSTTQQLNVDYQTFFDPAGPPTISYTPDPSVWGIDLASQINLRVRGWGYHSETGDVKSSYALAVYIGNFQCSSNVTPLPRNVAFWRYDGYSGAPLGIASLQSRIANFLRVTTGGQTVPVTTNQGELTFGICNDRVCDSYETPSSCPADCGRCNDGVCNSRFEDPYSCTVDCPGSCGDGYCVNDEPSTCPWDCSFCGDGVCNVPGEDRWSCPSDCQPECDPSTGQAC